MDAPVFGLRSAHTTPAVMFGHTAKASGYSLRNNKPLHQLSKTNTGSLTKKTLLLKCLAICCVIGSVGASAAERVSLVANAGSSPTYSMEFTDLQAKGSVHDENKRQEVVANVDSSPTASMAAAGNFDNDDYPDILIGNRPYLNQEAWVKHANLNFPSGRLLQLITLGPFTLDKCKARCLVTARCNGIVHEPTGPRYPNKAFKACWLHEVPTRPSTRAPLSTAAASWTRTPSSPRAPRIIRRSRT